jgi:hypothetical protein
MGKAKDIKNAIITKLTAMPALSDGTKLKSILDNTRGAFEGYPAAQLLPLNLVNDTLANHQQQRTSGYVILLHIPMEDTAETESQAYDIMYDLVDQITDTLDTGSFDLGVGALFLETTLADWQVATMKNGVTLLVRLDIKVMYTKDV